MGFIKEGIEVFEMKVYLTELGRKSVLNQGFKPISFSMADEDINYLIDHNVNQKVTDITGNENNKILTLSKNIIIYNPIVNGGGSKPLPIKKALVGDSIDINTEIQGPILKVIDNCGGTSTITASNVIGSLLWSTGETTSSIIVNSAGIYSATQRVDSRVSDISYAQAAPKTTPGILTITKVDDTNNSTSTLTVSNYTGTLLWSTNETTSSITVSINGTYSVTQTVNGCTSAKASIVASPSQKPVTPIVTVINNCDGSSTLTATNYTGALLWNTGETSSLIIVHSSGTYTVTQTVNGYTSTAASVVAAPKTAPAPPTVTSTTNFDNSTTFTAINYNGSLLWSTGEITGSIRVTTPGTYTVTQTVNDCTSAPTTLMAPTTTTTTTTTTQSTGTMTINNSYNIYVSDIVGNNIPSFPHTERGSVSVSFTNPIPSQTISVTLAGNYISGSDIKLYITVDGNLKWCVSVSGTGTYYLTIPETINSPSTFIIYIGGGTC